MILCIDAGNSNLKLGLFENDKLSNNMVLNYENPAIYKLIKSFLKICDQLIVASVKSKEWNLHFKEKIDFPITWVSYLSCFSFTIKYQTPETLGIDRLIACEGALKFAKKTAPILVIDCGTCITYDFINQKNEYLGGAISPGLLLRAKSMNNFTANLPLIDLSEKNIEFPGLNTQSCMKNGVLLGAICEIEGMIQQFRGIEKDLSIFLTGGDAIFFAKALKSNIFAEPNLNLIGLNQLASNNA